MTPTGFAGPVAASCGNASLAQGRAARSCKLYRTLIESLLIVFSARSRHFQIHPDFAEDRMTSAQKKLPQHDAEGFQPEPSSIVPADTPAAQAMVSDELLHLGLQQATSGQLEDAAETLAQSIMQNPMSAEAHEALTTVLLGLGNLLYATKAKAKSVGLGNNSPDDWAMLGDMFAALGQPLDASRAYGTALALKPDWPDVVHKLRALHAQTTQEPASLDLLGMGDLDARSIPDMWRRVSLVTIEPEGYSHVSAFADLVESFEGALRSLDIAVERRRNALGVDGINLLFGGHLISSQAVADTVSYNTVIVNLEQFRGFNIESMPIYASLMRRLAVWDYSAKNVERVIRMTGNRHVHHFGIGYSPVMTRQLPASQQTTDVLFYGSLNERRRSILVALERAGLKVRHLFNVYGAARDAAIADAKIVLNLHYYEDSIHEIVRTSFLLANGKAVVSECGPETEIDDDVREALVAVPYDQVVETCVALIADDARRHEIEAQGLRLFAQRDQAALLRTAIASTVLPIHG